MRLRTLGDRANPTALEDEAELITDLVADGPMKTKSFTALYIVSSDARQFRGVYGQDLVGKSTIDSFYQRDAEGRRANKQPELRSGQYPARNSGIART